MVCKKCGAEINDKDKCCPVCGEAIEQASGAEASSASGKAALSKVFFDPNEKMVAVLGSSFLSNLFSRGGLSKGTCVLSDKRLYYKGVCYTKDYGNFFQTDEENAVDVKDITASGFTRKYRYDLLVIAALLLIAGIITIGGLVFTFIPAVILLIIYNISKIKLFYVAFAGGRIAFRAGNYSKKEINEFQKALRLTIDACEERSD